MAAEVAEVLPGAARLNPGHETTDRQQSPQNPNPNPNPNPGPGYWEATSHLVPFTGPSASNFLYNYQYSRPNYPYKSNHALLALYTLVAHTGTAVFSGQ